jgi:hypothetical protein
MTEQIKRWAPEVALGIGLVVLAVVWRIVNHTEVIAPNLELVTAASLVASVFMRRPLGLVVTLAILFLSDLLIGNSSIAWFTWSAFGLIGLSGLLLRRWRHNGGRLMLGTVGMGLASALIFFLWTNFGVWWQGSGEFYPHTWQGLMECYAMGLPFFRATLISGVVVAPALMAGVYVAPSLVSRIMPNLASRLAAARA